MQGLPDLTLGPIQYILNRHLAVDLSLKNFHIKIRAVLEKLSEKRYVNHLNSEICNRKY